jgi:hypothetical protein
MKALKVKTNNENNMVIVLCSCGNLLELDPKELHFLAKKLLVCEKCNAEIVVVRDNEICSGQDL